MTILPRNALVTNLWAVDHLMPAKSHPASQRIVPLYSVLGLPPLIVY